MITELNKVNKKLLICDFCNQKVRRYKSKRKRMCQKCYKKLLQPKEICFNCKDQQLVVCRKDNKPYCQSCYNIILKPRRICFNCNENKLVHCWKDERPYCLHCYKKNLRPKKICFKCGRNQPVHCWKNDRPHCQNCYKKFKRATDESFRIAYLIRNRISVALKRNKIPKKPCKVDIEGIIKHLGPCPGELKDYHIDHVIPLAFFDLTDPEQFRIAFAPENHQWLTVEENLRKGAKLIERVL